VLYILSAIELSYIGYLLWIQNHIKKYLSNGLRKMIRTFFPFFATKKIIHLSFCALFFFVAPPPLNNLLFFSIVLSQSMFLFLTYLANTVDINDLFPWNVYQAFIGIPFCYFLLFPDKSIQTRIRSLFFKETIQQKLVSKKESFKLINFFGWPNLQSVPGILDSTKNSVQLIRVTYDIPFLQNIILII